MKSLYLILDLASISIPFLASFHPRLQFYKKWKSLFLSLLITSALFVIWDILFTKHGVWGFNDAYFIGIEIANMPIEEYLFFICIPYACVFSHYALLELFPKFSFPEKYLKSIVVFLTIGAAAMAIINYHRWYTLINFSYFAILVPIIYAYRKRLLQQYLITFLFMLIPFFIVNGILTGSWIDDQVVWYNNDENLNLRMGTIPVEDTFYAFTLILTNLGLMTFFEKKEA